MNRLLSSFFIVLLALPMALPWMPHGVAHALHDQSISHREANLHSRAAHSHAAEHLQDRFVEDAQSTTHHSIDVSVVTYFDEYLLVDLASSKKIVSAISANPMQDIDFHWAPHASPKHDYMQTSHRDRAPPIWRTFRPNHTPVYLNTQRFRI